MTIPHENSRRKEDRTLMFNRIMYTAFIVFGLWFALISRDLAATISNLGIALMFDPFDYRISWVNRPRFQQIWLLGHVALVLALGGLYFLHHKP